MRELRDIATLAPPYNSASRRQANQHWVVREGNRAVVVPSVSLADLPRALGPFGTRAHATRAANAIGRVVAEATGTQSADLIDEAVAASSLTVPDALTAVMARLAAQGLFEPAARARDELAAYMAGVERATMRPVLSAARIVWGTRRDGGEPGWLVHVASYGRYLSSLVVPPHTDPTAWIEVASATEPLTVDGQAAKAASWAETALICAQLSEAGTRLIEWDSPLPWAQPTMSPLRDGRLRELLAQATAHPYDRLRA